jgi:putative hydrolase of the HAD superfamily
VTTAHPASTSRLEAVIFDWGGTLTPWHTVDVRATWLAYAEAYAAGDASDAAALAERLHLAEDALWTGARDRHESATLHDVFRAAGVDPAAERHAVALEAYRLSWEPHTWTDPEALPMLTALRERGLRIGILSNTMWSRQHHEDVLARDGVLHVIDGAVYTSEIPWTKPHPEAFLAAMAAVGVADAGRVVFVGDRPFDDIHGAKSVGMRAVLLPHSVIPDVQRGHTEGDPDAVIHSLADLVHVIDGWLGSAGSLRQPGEGVRGT